MIQQLFEDSDDDDLDVGQHDGLDVNNAGNAGGEVEDVEEPVVNTVTPDNSDSDSF
jgi:hypothetical protein